MGFSKKTVYHGDLVRAGEIFIRVNSGKNASKFKQPHEAGGFWVGFDYDGGQYQYAAESEACADDLAKWEGCDVTIRASGRDASDAIIEILGPDGHPTTQNPQPQAQQPRQPQRPPQQNNRQQQAPRGPQNNQRPPQQAGRQQAQQPRQPAPRATDEAPPDNRPVPIHGQTVGMGINQANRILLEINKDPLYFDSAEYSKDLYFLASDIIRVANLIQEGKLAPKIKDRVAQAPAPQEERQPEPERPKTPTAEELAAMDDVPF